MIWLFAVLSTVAWGAPEQALKDRVVKALTNRDGGPACEVMRTWGAEDEMASVMRNITETVSMPPWVPMRAAQCVVKDAKNDVRSWSVIEGWMSHKETAGYALLVMQNVDGFEPKRAEVLAELAVKRAVTEPRFGRLVERSMNQSRHIVVVERAKKLPTP